MKTVNQHAQYSLKRIATLQKHLSNSQEMNKHSSDFCIYTTGSYGRLEASKFSDMDLFFLFDNETNRFSKISKTIIDADIIKACRKMRLPEFSGDGEYLEIHNIKEIYTELGSRNDDYRNFFSARMLLLLESKAIYNQEFYDKTIEETIERYYKDFHDHTKDFRPLFLVNDIIRFWRTMCLNYEHTRNRKFNNTNSKLTEEEISYKKNEVHIKNLKLKFSRKLTCFSFLLSVLLQEDAVLTQEHILKITKFTPLQRLQKLSEISYLKDDVNRLMDLYFWFLNTTQIDKSELINWIGILKNRDFAFDKSREFAKVIFEIMLKAKKQENLLYFLV